MWEWTLVTSAAVWPVQRDRPDCGSTAGRPSLEGDKMERHKIDPKCKENSLNPLEEIKTQELTRYGEKTTVHDI